MNMQMPILPHSRLDMWMGKESMVLCNTHRLWQPQKEEQALLKIEETLSEED